MCSILRRMRDASNRSAGAARWTCPACGVSVDVASNMCGLCLRARPLLPAPGQPLVFEGMHIHFNGVIPRTMRHISHSAEFRMAERHGAVVEEIFDVTRVTHLVYRVGYERSDKVRRALRANIPCLPIDWFLESLMQSRPLLVGPMRLRAVPDASLPTTAGLDLPHHSHPFYVAHGDEYLLEQPSPQGPSFVVPAKGGGGGDRRGADGADAAGGGGALFVYPAPMPPLSVRNCVAAACAAPVRADTSGLFGGIRAALTPHVAATCGGAIAAFQARGGSVVDTHDSATHVVFASDDKKGQLMQDAAAALEAGAPLLLVTIGWIEDSLMLAELLPPVGPYAATAKLLQTLAKRRTRGAAVSA